MKIIQMRLIVALTIESIDSKFYSIITAVNLYRHLQLQLYPVHFEWTKVMHVLSEFCSAAVSEFITMNFNFICI